MKAVITVIGHDTVGVVARVSAVCAELNINIEDITQSILQDMFCMIMLVDISTILSAAKVHVSSLNARSTADGFALISLAVDVSDSQQLQAVMRRLEQISGVMRVTRPAG